MTARKLTNLEYAAQQMGKTLSETTMRDMNYVPLAA
jgi:hypothetical protein